MCSVPSADLILAVLLHSPPVLLHSPSSFVHLLDFSLVISWLAIVIAATENDTLPKQFLAPFAGAAIGAELRDRGSHALLVYDDFATFSMSYNRLSKYVRACRCM